MNDNKPLDDDAGIIAQSVNKHKDMMTKLSDQPFIFNGTKEEFEKKMKDCAPPKEFLDECKMYADKYKRSHNVYRMIVNENSKDAPVMTKEKLDECTKRANKYPKK